MSKSISNREPKNEANKKDMTIEQQNINMSNTTESFSNQTDTPTASSSSFSSSTNRKKETNKPRGATYDGNLCMVCSDRASGFHYGVLACEGCKGFFKRFCKEKAESNVSSNEEILSTKRHCVFGGSCDINLLTRNRCQFCRMQKCIELGMSKNGIKLGRRSKNFKQNLNKILLNNKEQIAQELVKTHSNGKSLNTDVKLYNLKKTDTNLVTNMNQNQTPHVPTQIIAILQDNKLIIKAIDLLNNNLNNNNALLLPTSSSGNVFVQQQPIQITSMPNKLEEIRPIINNQTSMNDDKIMEISDKVSTQNGPVDLVSTSCSSNDPILQINSNQLKEVVELIVKSHNNTNFKCTQMSSLDETNFPILNSTNELNQDCSSLKAVFEKGLLSLLNETQFLDYFNSLIEDAVLFAKHVPYFMNINEADRITLLKSCVFKIICVRHAFCFSNSLSLSSNAEQGDIKISNESKNLATLAECAVAAANGTQSVQNNDRINSKTFDSAKFLIPSYNVWVELDWLCKRLPQLDRFLKILYEFYSIFNQVDLNENALALFSTCLLFSSDELSLNESENLKKYRQFYNQLLINELKKSEKRNFEGQEILNWLDLCCKHLKELNDEHGNILNHHKQFIQFPDLYSELYNL